jgi:hypothetical protein
MSVARVLTSSPAELNTSSFTRNAGIGVYVGDAV